MRRISGAVLEIYVHGMEIGQRSQIQQCMRWNISEYNISKFFSVFFQTRKFVEKK